MLKLITITALAALSWLVVFAIYDAVFAYTCTTTCNTYGGQTTCTRNCW